MPASTKKEKEILFFSLLLENNWFFFFFENLKILRKTQISHGAQLWGRQVHINTDSSFESPSRWQCLFFLLVCIIMASRRALLAVYLVSLVYVRSAKCLGREEGDVGMGRWGWAHNPAHPALKFLYIHSHQGRILHQSPPCPTPPKPITRTWRWAEPGKNTILFDQVFKTTRKRKKRNSFFNCWQPF